MIQNEASSFLSRVKSIDVKPPLPLSHLTMTLLFKKKAFPF